MALIAIMENEFVHKRKWVTQDQFLDFVATTNIVPGPNACEMAAHIGYTYAGHPGLVVAELSFLIPAVTLSAIFGVLYVRYGTLPQISAIFYGINPVILALILNTTYRLSKRTLTSFSQFLILILSIAASFFKVNEALIIFGAGLLAIAIQELPHLIKGGQNLIFFLPVASIHLPLKSLLEVPENILLRLFMFFLKTGSLIFGSGMVLFAFIQKDIVENFGWLTQQELIDAIAVGQMTPGPVMSSSAFIGYLIAGLPGAAISAIGIFLPSFFIVAAIGPLIPKMRESKTLMAFLRGVNAAVIALMLMICLTIAKTAIIDVWTLILLVSCVLILFFYKIDSIWLVLGGAAIGLARHLLG